LSTNTLKKLYVNKVTLEDLEVGFGKVTQTRGGQAVTLTKINPNSLNFDYGGIICTSKVSDVEDMVITSGCNAFSIDSFILVDGATLIIEDDAIYKVI